MSLIVLEQELKDYRIPAYEKLNEEISDEVILYYWKKEKSTTYNVLDKEDISIACKGINVIRLINNKLFIPNIFIKGIYKKENTLLIRGNIRNLFLIPLILLNKILGVKTIVAGQAFSRFRGFNPYRNLVDFLYLLIVRISDAYVVYDQHTKRILNNYIGKENKIYVANNTLDTDKEFEYLQKLEGKGKKNIKRELGIKHTLALGFIGRLIERTRLDYLLDVFQMLSKENKDIGLYIIGRGPESLILRKKIQDKDISNVVLIGPKYDYESAKYLFALDIIVMPGALGLAVNHSMIYGTPIVSQKKNDSFIGHGPEAIHLKHKYNGWFAKYNDKEDMVNGIKEIIDNYNIYSKNASEYAKEYLTIDKMVQRFVQAYQNVQK